MADVTFTSTLIGSKSGAYVTSQTTGTSFTDTMTGSDVISGTYTLTNAFANLDKGAITTIGWFWLRSLSASATDVCSVSTDAGTTTAGICKAGLPFGPIYRNSATQIQVKFSAGVAHDVFFVACEA